MADMIIELASRQRKRLVASALNAAERSPWWGKLTPREQTEYRDKLLASIGVYHDFMLDVLRVSTETVSVNDHVLELLEQVHDQSTRMASHIEQLGQRV